MGITHLCENAHFRYKILQYICFNCTCYTCSYDKCVWDMSQYNKLSNIQYARFQILHVDLHFGLFWSAGIPTMGIVTKGISSISAWPLYQNMQSVYMCHSYIRHIHLICQSCILINPCRILCGQRERKLDEPHICVLRSPVYNAAIANIQLPDQLTFPNRYVWEDMPKISTFWNTIWRRKNLIL